MATWFQNRFGVELDPSSEIIELIGSKEGLAHAAWAFIDPGDVALVPDPAYTVVKVNTLLAGGTPYELPLLAENGFLPDLSAIPGDVVKQAKLMYLNYPNNPTGAVATREFFQEAVNFARETGILILHDCAYAEVGYDGYQAPSILEIEGAKEVAIETHSLSKTFNMTGWRIGFAVGNPDALRALNTIKGNVDSKQFSAIALTAGWALNHANNDEALAPHEAPPGRSGGRPEPAGLEAGEAPGRVLRLGARAARLHVGHLRPRAAGKGRRPRHPRPGLRPARRRLRPHVPDRQRRPERRDAGRSRAPDREERRDRLGRRCRIRGRASGRLVGVEVQGRRSGHHS